MAKRSKKSHARAKTGSVIESTEDFVRITNSFDADQRLLFRGQNVDKPLRPKIARRVAEMGITDTETIERKMLERFKKESMPLIHGIRPESDWDWLSVAQHQGLPTRLLDWSSSPLIALWFAVAEDPPNPEEQGVLWVLKVKEGDLKSPGHERDIFQLGRTYIFQPFHIDQRISAQAGWFSVHKYSTDKEKFSALNLNRTFKHLLTKQIGIENLEKFPLFNAEFKRRGLHKNAHAANTDVQKLNAGNAKSTEGLSNTNLLDRLPHPKSEGIEQINIQPRQSHSQLRTGRKTPKQVLDGLRNRAAARKMRKYAKEHQVWLRSQKQRNDSIVSNWFAIVRKKRASEYGKLYSSITDKNYFYARKLRYSLEDSLSKALTSLSKLSGRAKKVAKTGNDADGKKPLAVLLKDYQYKLAEYQRVKKKLNTIMNEFWQEVEIVDTVAKTHRLLESKDHPRKSP